MQLEDEIISSIKNRELQAIDSFSNSGGLVPTTPPQLNAGDYLSPSANRNPVINVVIIENENDDGNDDKVQEIDYDLIITKP